MARGMVIVLVIGLLAGCRAPTPSMSCLTPYMDSTVPPPRTGAIGSNGMYYSPPASGVTGAPPAAPPATGVPAVPAAPGAGGTGGPVFTPPSQPLTPPTSYMGASTANPDSAVTLASFQAGRPDEIASPQTDELSDESADKNIVTGSATDSAVAHGASDPNSLKLNGMPVNDASEPAPLPEGAAGGEPKNIATASGATGNSPSFLRFINPRPASDTPASGGTPVQPPSSAAAADSWQSRS